MNHGMPRSCAIAAPWARARAVATPHHNRRAPTEPLRLTPQYAFTHTQQQQHSAAMDVEPPGEAAVSDEAIEAFCGVTGAPRHVAEHYLSSFGGNIDSAIGFYLENDGGGAPPPPPRAGGAGAAAVEDDDEATARAIAASMSEEDALLAARLYQEDVDPVVVTGTRLPTRPLPPPAPVSVDLTADDAEGQSSSPSTHARSSQH